MRGNTRKRQQGGHLDLFGQVPCTWDDVWQWIETVPGIARDSWRAAYYARYWNVPDKVREAKAAGRWPPQTTSQ